MQASSLQVMKSKRPVTASPGALVVMRWVKTARPAYFRTCTSNTGSMPSLMCSPSSRVAPSKEKVGSVSKAKVVGRGPRSSTCWEYTYQPASAVAENTRSHVPASRSMEEMVHFTGSCMAGVPGNWAKENRDAKAKQAKAIGLMLAGWDAQGELHRARRQTGLVVAGHVLHGPVQLVRPRSMTQHGLHEGDGAAMVADKHPEVGVVLLDGCRFTRGADGPERGSFLQLDHGGERTFIAGQAEGINVPSGLTGGTEPNLQRILPDRRGSELPGDRPARQDGGSEDRDSDQGKQSQGPVHDGMPELPFARWTGGAGHLKDGDPFPA